ncbi:developmental pluripotency-associated protein 4-like [Rhynchocyon petersi]
MKKLKVNSTLVKANCVKANKQQIKQAVQKLYESDVAKLHLIWDLNCDKGSHQKLHGFPLLSQNSTQQDEEEYVTLHFEPVLETEEHPVPDNLPSTSNCLNILAEVAQKKRKRKVEKASCSQDNSNSKPRKKADIPPLPDILPPIDEVHRDTVRGWCQLLKLSTKGKKAEVYQRVLRAAYPHLQNIFPVENYTTAQTRLRRKRKEDKQKPPRKRSKKEKMSSEKTDSPGVPPAPAEGAPVLDGTFLEVDNTVVVTTSAMEAKEAKEASQEEAESTRWCVVHGKSFPTKSRGWVRLQFHAGQAWVPEKPGKVVALFLPPSCISTPRHLEDNLLCSICVHR